MRTTLVCLALLLAACASPGDPTVDLAGMVSIDGGGQRCMPGATADCTCLGGGMGTKTCRASGLSYGTCTGCGTEDPDMFSVAMDAGSSPCGECDGCCDGTTCVPFASQTNAKCGERGDSCATCGTRICDTENGVCLDAAGGCNATNCANGCCKTVNGMSSCQINQPTACGTGGGACTTCQSGVTCNGQCTNTINPNYNFRIFVKSLNFDSRDDGEACWDFEPLPGCPDMEVKVCFGYFQGSTLIEGCTVDTTVDDTGPTGTITIPYNDTTGLVKLSNGQALQMKGSTITAGQMRISVRELDNTGDDLIAQGYLNAISTKQVPFTINNWVHVNQLKFEIR